MAIEMHIDSLPAYAKIMAAAQHDGLDALLGVYLTTKILANGPKVYQPRDADCFAMEAIRPQVPLAEYRQPFPTFLIELPDAYRQARRVKNLRPVAIALHHDDNLLLSSVFWENGGLSFSGLAAEHPEETVEQIMARMHQKTWQDELPPLDEESSYAESAIRLGINACLLLMHYGCRALGYDNPSHAARLQRRLAKNKKGDRVQQQMQHELDVMPLRYGFDQVVTLYDREEGAAEMMHQGGWTVKPHWRAGHWRMQVFGAGRAERKRIFIKPVLVKGDQLVQSPTSVMYRPARSAPAVD
jgi:hypothetical protein